MATDPLLMAGYELAKEVCFDEKRGYWGVEACVRRTMRMFKRDVEMLSRALRLLGL